MASWRKPDWPTLAVLAGMYIILIGNHILYWTSPLPLVVHILLSAVAIHLAFTIWHEAVHGNVSQRSGVNDLVGVVGMFPYMTPYFMQKWIHLQHHARLNEEDDPNYVYTDGPFWKIPLRYPRALGYAKKVLARDPRGRGERISDTVFLAAVAGVYALAWWYGVLADVLLLWFVPVIIAKVVMDWYINYLPHVGLPADRYLGTRIVDVPWLTPLVLVHNYHAIHHLWPTIPWHRYRAVFRRKLGYLQEHRVPIEHGVFQRRAPSPSTTLAA
jgi:fatty acid desaturase